MPTFRSFGWKHWSSQLQKPSKWPRILAFKFMNHVMLWRYLIKLSSDFLTTFSFFWKETQIKNTPFKNKHKTHPISSHTPWFTGSPTITEHPLGLGWEDFSYQDRCPVRHHLWCKPTRLNKDLLTRGCGGKGPFVGVSEHIPGRSRRSICTWGEGFLGGTS